MAVQLVVETAERLEFLMAALMVYLLVEWLVGRMVAWMEKQRVVRSVDLKGES